MEDGREQRGKRRFLQKETEETKRGDLAEKWGEEACPRLSNARELAEPRSGAIQLTDLLKTIRLACLS